MAVSKAQQRAVAKYTKANYDLYQVRMPKGKKDLIQSHAEVCGESVNGFINRAINETMERDSGGSVPATAPAGSDCGATTTGNAGIGTLAPDVIHAAQTAAEAAKEETADFVTRAIQEQAKRDTVSRKLGI
jgi:hypothetical protein